MFKWQINLDRQGLRPLSITRLLPNPPWFSFPTTFKGLFHTLPKAPADAAAPELAPVRTAEAGPRGLDSAACASPAVGLAQCVRIGSPPWSSPFRNLIIGVWGLQGESLSASHLHFAFKSVRAAFYATTFFKFYLHVSPFLCRVSISLTVTLTIRNGANVLSVFSSLII